MINLKIFCKSGGGAALTSTTVLGQSRSYYSSAEQTSVNHATSQLIERVIT